MKSIFLEFYRFTNSHAYSLEVVVDDRLTNAQITNFIYDVAGDFCKIADCSSWSVVKKLGY